MLKNYGSKCGQNKKNHQCRKKWFAIKIINWPGKNEMPWQIKLFDGKKHFYQAKQKVCP